VKSILDPTFRYVRSTDTDIRKTFKRVRDELAAVKAIGAPSPQIRDATDYATPLPANVKALPKKKETA
jgi:hypothetical protein